jgi:glyoxylase-like metal-dependent hydrolase (beta-lactamase superfamily II)
MDEELLEGDVIRVGRREIGFLHTPGHNRWHLTPYILGESIYFTGDLVLENISSVYAEIDGNLNDYYNSLHRLSRLPVERLLPAHGQEPESPARAIRLLSKTLGLLERGVMRRLKQGQFDLKELAVSAMGAKIMDSSHFITAIAIIHAIIQKFNAAGCVQVHEIEPPYEQYSWRADCDESLLDPTRGAGARNEMQRN